MRLSSSNRLGLTTICVSNSLLIYCQRCSQPHACFLKAPDSSDTLCSRNEDRRFVGCCVSPSSTFIAAISVGKVLYVWKEESNSNEDHWKLFSIFQLNKRPMDLVFDVLSANVLVADKTGDVLRINLAAPMIMNRTDLNISVPSNTEDSGESPAPILLGHLSMLLTIDVSFDGLKVITGDRDEKVRVSNYPRAYDISCFCLGHSEFVGQVRCLATRPFTLATASGDGTIRLWNLESGEELSCTDTSEESSKYVIEDKQSDGTDSKSNLSLAGRERVVPQQCAITCMSITSAETTDHTEELLAVCFDRSKAVVVYKLPSNCPRLEHVDTLELPCPPFSVVWLDSSTLAAICSSRTSPVLVWQITDRKHLSAIEHPLAVFASQHSLSFQELFIMDPMLLFKQRFDNVAEYQQKKEIRISNQQELQRKRLGLQAKKRIKLRE